MLALLIDWPSAAGQMLPVGVEDVVVVEAVEEVVVEEDVVVEAAEVVVVEPVEPVELFL